MQASDSVSLNPLLLARVTCGSSVQIQMPGWLCLVVTQKVNKIYYKLKKILLFLFHRDLSNKLFGAYYAMCWVLECSSPSEALQTASCLHSLTHLKH